MTPPSPKVVLTAFVSTTGECGATSPASRPAISERATPDARAQVLGAVLRLCLRPAMCAAAREALQSVAPTSGGPSAEGARTMTRCKNSRPNGRQERQGTTGAGRSVEGVREARAAGLGEAPMVGTSSNATRTDVYARVTSEIIAAIEQGGAGEWHAPWFHNGASIARPTKPLANDIGGSTFWHFGPRASRPDMRRPLGHLQAMAGSRSTSARWSAHLTGVNSGRRRALSSFQKPLVDIPIFIWGGA